MRTLLTECSPPEFSFETRAIKPRIGFFGADAVARGAMAAVATSKLADIVAIADNSPELALQSSRIHPRAAVLSSMKVLLEVGVDGVIIATPGALAAEEAVAALGAGAVLIFLRAPGWNLEQRQQLVRSAKAAKSWNHLHGGFADALEELTAVVHVSDVVSANSLSIESERVEPREGFTPNAPPNALLQV